MRRVILILAMVGGAIYAHCADSSVERVLEIVEHNNLKLKAERELLNANTIGARVGNSLENPSVGFERLWGKPKEMGKANEFTISQAFDFPTAYAKRNQLAKAQVESFSLGYMVERQQVLLEAKMLIIDYVAGVQLRKIHQQRRDQAEKVLKIANQRFDKGDLSVIDLKKTQVEVLMAVREFDAASIVLETTVSRLKGINGGLEVDLSEFRALDLLSETIPSFDRAVSWYAESDYRSQAVSNDVSVAQKEVAVSKSASLPKFELGYKREFVPHQQMDGVMVGMSLPLWGNRHNVKRANAQGLVAAARVSENRLDVLTTLEGLYRSEKNCRETLVKYNEQAKEMAGYEQNIVKAFSSGELNMHEYYAELRLVHDVLAGQIELQAEYLKICAQINAVDL